MGMYEVLLATFSIGILTKFVDLIVDDDLKIARLVPYAAAISYGVLIAYVITNYPLLAPLGFAIVVAVLLTRKIDSKPHIAGVAFVVLFLILSGFPSIDLILFAVFLVAGGLDEMLNDFADKGKIKGIPAKIFEKRVVLEIAAFSVSLFTGYWILFLGMFSYDIGYLLTTRTGRYFK